MLATRIEGQTPLLQRCALCRFHVTDGLNTCDQIAFCAFHSFVVEIQTDAGYIHASMRNKNLEIRIGGSSCRMTHASKFGQY